MPSTNSLSLDDCGGPLPSPSPSMYSWIKSGQTEHRGECYDWDCASSDLEVHLKKNLILWKKFISTHFNSNLILMNMADENKKNPEKDVDLCTQYLAPFAWITASLQHGTEARSTSERRKDKSLTFWIWLFIKKPFPQHFSLLRCSCMLVWMLRYSQLSPAGSTPALYETPRSVFSVEAAALSSPLPPPSLGSEGTSGPRKLTHLNMKLHPTSKNSLISFRCLLAHRTPLWYFLLAFAEASLVLPVLFTHRHPDDRTQARPQEGSDGNPDGATSQEHAQRPHHIHSK